MDPATPRVVAQYLEQFRHHAGPVRILGKVTQIRGEEATIDAGGQIKIHLNRVRGPLASFGSDCATNT